MYYVAVMTCNQCCRWGREVSRHMYGRTVMCPALSGNRDWLAFVITYPTGLLAANFLTYIYARHHITPVYIPYRGTL